METYSILREFADSWFLIAMTSFFIGTIIWAFRPGSWKVHTETAGIPFRHENAPAPAPKPCDENCDACGCGSIDKPELERLQ